MSSSGLTSKGICSQDLIRIRGGNQIKEIIHAAGCSDFFLDESQRVIMEDIGSVDEIRKWAQAEGSEVTEIKLVSQFRCNGANGYLAWIHPSPLGGSITPSRSSR